MTDLATCDHLFMSGTAIFLLLTTACIDTCAKAGHIVLGLNPSIIYGVEDPVFLWRRHRCEVSKNRHNLACSLSSSGRDSLRMNARIIRGKLAKTRHTSPTNSPVFFAIPPQFATRFLLLSSSDFFSPQMSDYWCWPDGETLFLATKRWPLITNKQ